MVMIDSGAQETLEALKKWYEALPSGVASWRESEDQYEHAVTIAPTNPRAAEVTFRFGSYGTFGVYFGLGGAGEDVPVSRDFALEVCEAARNGKIVEELRTVWGWRSSVRTRIQLKNRQLEDRMVTPLGFLPIGRRKQIAYEPWETSP